MWNLKVWSGVFLLAKGDRTFTDSNAITTSNQLYRAQASFRQARARILSAQIHRLSSHPEYCLVPAASQRLKNKRKQQTPTQDH